ncbi:MAG: hypothetical protein ACKV2T_27625 [Kofleriaceae bacterium]
MARQWIERGLGEPAFEQLAEKLAGTELQSVLLEVMQRRSAARKVPTCSRSMVPLVFRAA